MPLAAGQSLSFYEILGPLGVGGMGEVYRARDTRLEREVAIKVLPEELADDLDRLRRFEREAKTLASLNHPNVAGIHGVDQEGDVCFLALELVPGEDLATRLERGPLPVDEAIDVCRQIAEGLEAAHDAGVVHRDLKPANVRITPDGVVKVLDFGLAKPMNLPGSGSGTSGTATPDSFVATEEGVVLGTPTYMSPEQARGKPVDRRTDIWAFGCVLFECLTGERAFGGESMTDVLAAIVGKELDLSALPRGVPARVCTLLERCLDKEPRTRLRDIGEARLVLANPGEPASAHAGQGSGRSSRGRLWALVVTALVAGATGVRVLDVFREPRVAPADVRLAVHLPPGQELAMGQGYSLALSRDGSLLAWVSGRDRLLHVRRLDDYAVRVLEGTEGATTPCFSLDGSRLSFFIEDRLYRVATDGGTPELVIDEGRNLHEVEGIQTGDRGVTSDEHGTLTFAPSTISGLFQVSAEAPGVEVLTTIDVDADERTHRWPQALPGGDDVLFTVDDNTSPEYYDDARIEVVRRSTGERRVLIEGAGMARYADGTLVFTRGGDLHAVAFDQESLEVRGEPVRVVEGVVFATTSGAAQFALAEDGTLAWASGLARQDKRRLLWRSLADERTVLDLPPAVYVTPALSPDGQFLAYVDAGVRDTDIWLRDLERETDQRLTVGESAYGPLLTPDEEVVYYSRSARRIYARDTRGGERRVLVDGSGTYLTPSSITPDGEFLLFTWTQKETGQDIYRVPLRGGGEPEPLLVTPSGEAQAVLSPDGKWLAYSSNVSGRLEVYVARSSDTERRWPVSDRGGHEPRWTDDGAWLFYSQREEQTLWRVAVESGPELRLGSPERVLDDFFVGGYFANYDISPDGTRIMTMQPELDESSEPGEIRVVPRWTRTLDARLRHVR